MTTPWRAALKFIVIVAVLSGVAIWIKKQWPEYATTADFVAGVAAIGYFLQAAVNHDRENRKK